jgi:hypothetical protein
LTCWSYCSAVFSPCLFWFLFFGLGILITCATHRTWNPHVDLELVALSYLRTWLLRFPTGTTGRYKGASTHARAPVHVLYTENPEVAIKALQCFVQIDYKYRFRI